MGVSYLLVKLDKNYPPLPLVTHPLPLPVRFFPFFPTSQVTTPLRLAPISSSVVAREAAPPIPSLHPSTPASPPWLDPVDPVLLDLLHLLLRPHPWERPHLGLGFLVSYRAWPPELLLLASRTCPLRPAFNPPQSTGREPRPASTPPWPALRQARAASRPPWTAPTSMPWLPNKPSWPASSPYRPASSPYRLASRQPWAPGVWPLVKQAVVHRSSNRGRAPRRPTRGQKKMRYKFVFQFCATIVQCWGNLDLGDQILVGN